MSVIGSIFATFCIVVLGIVLQLATSFPMVIILIVVTSIWAAFDASKINLSKYQVSGTSSPATTLLGCLLLWIICFPWYLVNRGSVLRGDARLKENHATDHSELANEGSPNIQRQGKNDSSISVLKIALGICLGGVMLTFLSCMACGVLFTAGQKEIERQSKDPSAINMTKFNQLQEGMSYQEAVQILGKQGQEMSRSNIVNITTVLYSWSNSGSISNMNAMFQNDKLISKAQFGLAPSESTTTPVRTVQTEVKAAPEPDKEMEWRTVKEWSSNASKTTEDFQIVGSKWCIQWKSWPGEYGGGYFGVTVHDADGSPLKSVVNRSEPGEDVSYMRSKGTFYLDIGGDDHSWMVRINELVPKETQ